MTDRLLHCSLFAPVTQSPRLELLLSIRKTLPPSLDHPHPPLPLSLHLLHRPGRALHRRSDARTRIFHPTFPIRHSSLRFFLDLHSFPHFFRLARRPLSRRKNPRHRFHHLVRVHSFHWLLPRIHRAPPLP